MAHISRLRKTTFDKGKLAIAREQVAKEHREALQKRIEGGRKGAAKQAYQHYQNFKEKKKGWKPVGVFSFDEVILCKMRYGDEITKDADFWRFYQRASGQEFLLNA